eukprot:3891324-Ditylum_brightwellii.AAC.1
MMTMLSGVDKQLEKMYNVTMRIGTMKQHSQEHDMLDVFNVLVFRGGKLSSEHIDIIKNYAKVLEEQPKGGNVFLLLDGDHHAIYSGRIMQAVTYKVPLKDSAV